MFALTLLFVVCLLLFAAANEGSNGPLLDDSEYQRLVEFDKMLDENVQSVAGKIAVEPGSASVAESLTLNYANIAMMYHQRNVRWKQGGNAESLHYISLAISHHTNPHDAAHSDRTLVRSMMLHKARMLASLGRRYSALSILNELLSMQNSSSDDEADGYIALFQELLVLFGATKPKTLAMSKQELSNILYHKAELLLTLFDDFQAALELFREALDIYPCHYLAHHQVVQALKATKSATREDWLVEIDRMIDYLMNTRQRPRHSMKHVHKYSAPLIDFNRPMKHSRAIDTKLDYSSLTSFAHSMYNNLLYWYDRLRVPATEVVCTFSNAHSTDNELYAYISPVRTVTSLYAIYASVSWAIFQAADAVPELVNEGSDSATVPSDEEVRGVAWKYLQQARHFERLRINEQIAQQEYQQATLRDEDGEEDGGAVKSKDRVSTTSSGGAEHSQDADLSFEEHADRAAMEHSAAQTRHLVQFFQRGYWGDADSYYAGYEYEGDHQQPTATANTAANCATDAAAEAVAASDPATATPADPTAIRSTNAVAEGPTVQQLLRQGSKTRVPIFIVGFFRSGSTLLEGLLESHSGLQWTAEPNEPIHKQDGAEQPDELNESAGRLGFKRKAIWGMGEDSPLVFEMYAMQEETLEAYAELEKQKQDLQARQPEKSTQGKKTKKSSHKKVSVEDLEQQFVAKYKQIVDKKASTIVGKMLQRFTHYHGADIANLTSEHACNANVGSDGAGSGNVCANPWDTANSSTTTTPLPMRIVDKMLTNYVNIGLIHLVFPRAIILHTVRDPLDTLFSCYANRFGDPSAAYTLHAESLVLKYVHYLEVMQHFRSVLAYYSLPVLGSKSTPSAEKSGKKSVKPTRRIQALVDVRYEELVANPQRTLQHLLENVLGVPYAAPVAVRPNNVPTSSTSTRISLDEGPAKGATMNGSSARESNHKADPYVRVVQTASRLQVKEPVYGSSVGRWRKYSAQLQSTLIPALRAHLPRLAALQALPYLAHNSSLAATAELGDGKKSGKKSSAKVSKAAKKCATEIETGNNTSRDCVFMNWELDPHFDYKTFAQQLR